MSAKVPKESIISVGNLSRGKHIVPRTMLKSQHGAEKPAFAQKPITQVSELRKDEASRAFAL